MGKWGNMFFSMMLDNKRGRNSLLE